MKTQEAVLEEDLTTVQCKKKTREELSKLGLKHETYDDILNKLIKYYKEGHEVGNRKKPHVS